MAQELDSGKDAKNTVPNLPLTISQFVLESSLLQSLISAWIAAE